MARQIFTFSLCILLVASMMCGDAWAIAPAPALSRNAQRSREAIGRLGIGNDTLIAVRLLDKSTASGYVSEIRTQSFSVADPQTNEQRTIAYSQIDRLQGYNLATGAEVHQGLGVRAKIARAALRVFTPVRLAPVNNLNKRNTLIVGVIVGILLAIILGKVL